MLSIPATLEALRKVPLIHLCSRYTNIIAKLNSLSVMPGTADSLTSEALGILKIGMLTR